MWSTALPAMRRSSRAWIASPASRQLASRSIWVSSSPRATRPASRARSAAPPPRTPSSGKTKRPWSDAPGASRNSAAVGKTTSAASLAANETIVPRGATRRIAAESVAPPTPSTIVSKRSPSVVISWTISSAPSASRPFARSGLAETAVTCAPPRLASWTAKRPTPPEAPVTRTRRPSSAPPISRAYSAVRPATGSVAAWASETASGSGARMLVGTATFSAHAPREHEADDARALGRAAAVGRGALDGARDVPARDGAGRVRRQAPDLAAVEGERADLHQGLVRRGLRIGHLCQFDVRVCDRSGECEHRRNLHSRGHRSRAARMGRAWTRTPTPAPSLVPWRGAGRRGRPSTSRRSRRGRGRRAGGCRRTTAGCARRSSATATASCTARPSGGSSTRPRSSSRPRATTSARG